MANMTEVDALRYSSFTTDENLTPDDFILYQDIDKAHSDMIDRYYVLKNKTFTTDSEKTEMTQLLVNLQEYMVTSDAFNKLCACIKTMQMFMRDGIVVFINEKKTELIELMQSYKKIGEWNSTTSYNTGNVVVHNGFSFLSKVANNLNHEPNNGISEDDYWLRLTIKGDKGDPSLNISYKGEYNPSTTYNLGDACTYNGVMYYTDQDGVIGILPTDQTKWAYVDKVIISDTEPTDTHVIWWDTSVGNNNFKRYTSNNIWEEQNIKASNVSVVDSSNYYTSENLEGVLDEVGTQLSNIEQQTSESMNILLPTNGSTSNSILLNVTTFINNKKYSFKANANSTGNVTINGKAFKKSDGTQIGNSGIKNGKVYDFYYDETTDSVFILAKAEGDATVADVLAGKFFSNGDDTNLVGTIPRKSAQIYTPSTINQTISANIYTSGIQTILGDPNLIASNIINTATIFGVTGSAKKLQMDGGSFSWSQTVATINLSFAPNIVFVSYVGFNSGSLAYCNYGSISNKGTPDTNDASYLQVPTDGSKYFQYVMSKNYSGNTVYWVAVALV